MRLMIEFLTLYLAIGLTMAAYDGAIYTFRSDGQTNILHNGIVRQDLVKLVLEQRMKLSRLSSVGTVGEEVVELLNQYGGQQTQLFDGVAHDDQQRLLIIFEGVENETVSAFIQEQQSNILIPQISSGLVDDKFFENVLELESADFVDPRTCVFYFKGKESGFQAPTSRFADARECLSRYPILEGAASTIRDDLLSNFSEVFMESWVGGRGSVGILKLGFEKPRANPLYLAKFLLSLLGGVSTVASEFRQEITVLLVPSSHPNTAPKHKRRPTSNDGSLSNFSNPALSAPGSPVTARLQQTRDSLSTFISVCHVSELSCVTSTNNCSGHGNCELKYASNNEAVTSDCYTCKCQPTTAKDSDGTFKTIQWGGRACEKEDISTTFFLLLGITIVVIVAISNGVKMLFSVGQEGLPSVIGAGVGSPKTQR